MSKFDYYKMCEKIFGKKHTSDPETGRKVDYTRKDMLNKLLEFKEKIETLENENFEYELLLKCHRNYNEEVGRQMQKTINDYEARLAKKDEEISKLKTRVNSVYGESRYERRGRSERFSDTSRFKRSSYDRKLDLIEEFFDKLLAEFDAEFNGDK